MHTSTPSILAAPGLNPEHIHPFSLSYWTAIRTKNYAGSGQNFKLSLTCPGRSRLTLHRGLVVKEGESESGGREFVSRVLIGSKRKHFHIKLLGKFYRI